MREPTGCLYCQGIERDKCLNCQTYEKLIAAKAVIKQAEWYGGGGYGDWDQIQPNWCPWCKAPAKSYEHPEAGVHSATCPALPFLGESVL